MSTDININLSDTELNDEIVMDLDTELDLIEIEDSANESASIDDDESTENDDDYNQMANEGVAFDSLGLPEALTALLAKGGVTHAFPIQSATIPDALAGRHVLGKARTGSGKTLAFGLPMLANLEGKRARKGKPLALILVPTRELAMQVSEALRPYGFAIGLDITAVYGGAPMYKQVWSLRRGVEVLVATPGRLTDLIEQEECDLSDVRIAVLDEADQMADMGFMPIVSELLGQTDPAGQRLLFSATLDGAVDVLVKKYLTDPVTHSVASDEGTPIRMDHHLLVVEPNDKSMITAEIAARHTPGDEDKKRTILFARTKLGADRIAEKIREAGVAAVALHGGMTQRARTKTLEDFKLGRVPVLVATDVAARGIHVDGVDLVLHVDPANDPKDYLHRAGRTARAGEAGTVVTLVLPKQRKATVRLLEQAGVEAELTKVLPSSDILRELTGGRPVEEYKAEADAYYAARRAEREARGGSQREERGSHGDRGGRPSFGDRDSRGGGDRGGYRGGSDRPSFGGTDRDRRSFGGSDSRGDRPSFGGDRSTSRPSYGDRPANTRPAFGDRDTRGGDRPSFDRPASSDRPSFDRPRTDRPAGDRPSFGGGDRDRGARPSYGDRDNRGASSNSSSSSSYGDRGARPSYGDRDNRSGDRPTGGSSYGGNRSSSDRPSYGDRDRNAGSGSTGASSSFGRNGGERKGFGGGTGNRDSRPSTGDRDARPPRDRRF